MQVREGGRLWMASESTLTDTPRRYAPFGRLFLLSHCIREASESVSWRYHSFNDWEGNTKNKKNGFFCSDIQNNEEPSESSIPKVWHCNKNCLNRRKEQNKRKIKMKNWIKQTPPPKKKKTLSLRDNEKPSTFCLQCSTMLLLLQSKNPRKKILRRTHRWRYCSSGGGGGGPLSPPPGAQDRGHLPEPEVRWVRGLGHAPPAGRRPSGCSSVSLCRQTKRFLPRQSCLGSRPPAEVRRMSWVALFVDSTHQLIWT